MPPPSFEDIAIYFVVTYIVVSVGQMLWEKRRQIPSILGVYRATPYVYARASGVAILTLLLAGLAYYHSPSFLQWGWLSLFLSNNANPITQPIVQSKGYGGIWSVAFILLFYAALVITLPLVAMKEERMFRAGHHTPAGVVIQAFKFGLSHMIVGIPIIICLVLVLPGIHLSLRYRSAYLDALDRQIPPQQAIEEGVKASHVDHSIYNLTLLTFLVAGTLFLNLHAGSR